MVYIKDAVSIDFKWQCILMIYVVGDQPKTAINHNIKSHTNITLDINVDQQKQPIESN